MCKVKCKKLKAQAQFLSCRRKMTAQDLMREILKKNPLVSEEQIQEKLEAERDRTRGLLGDETLLRLIAAKFGVSVQQNCFSNNGVLSTNRLIAGLNDVTVAGRLIAVFPAKTFQGVEKSGKFATLMMADNDGILRVVLWNEKAELVEKGELKVNQAVKLLHGYTREDRCGKTELHLGGKSQIEIDCETKAAQYPPIEKFTVKINTLTAASGNVMVSGTIKDVLPKKNFTRTDMTDGAVMRLTLADDSGQVTVVAWNEKVVELENAPVEVRLLLVNAKVKENQGGIEVHVDSNTFVHAQTAS
jgi:replication factor A1